MTDTQCMGLLQQQAGQVPTQGCHWQSTQWHPASWPHWVNTDSHWATAAAL